MSKTLSKRPKLSGLLGAVDGIVLSGRLDETVVNEIVVDSRHVRPGSLFVAIEGTSMDSHDFITDAIARGAAAIICKRWDSAVDARSATVVQVRDPRRLFSRLSANYWGNPARRLKTIGCTGTDGKTTTTMAIEHILTRAGHRTGLVGTINCRIAGESVPTDYTTPPPQILHELFAAMVGAEVTHCVMEVSSQGLAQHRVADVPFAAAVLTNLTEDHIEAHGSFENYRAAKGLLFESLAEDAPAVLNAGDPQFRWFRSITAGRVVGYGLWPIWADVQAEIGYTDLNGMQMRISTPDWHRVVQTELIGAFNAENLLAAAATCWALGVDVEAICAGIESFRRPAGRLEVVAGPAAADQPCVIVDYAHNAHSLRTVLSTLRPLVRGKLIACFGCGGNRDKAKRGPMGATATEFCDHVVVTTDNSRFEDPHEIVGQIVHGIPENRTNFEVILDRHDAIARTIQMAQDHSDCCVLLGKGHETGQIEQGLTRPFDDRQVAARVLTDRLNQRKSMTCTYKKAM